MHCWWEHKLVPALKETVWQHFLRLNIGTVHDLAIYLLSIYSTQPHAHAALSEDRHHDAHSGPKLKITQVSNHRMDKT